MILVWALALMAAGGTWWLGRNLSWRVRLLVTGCVLLVPIALTAYVGRIKILDGLTVLVMEHPPRKLRASGRPWLG